MAGSVATPQAGIEAVASAQSLRELLSGITLLNDDQDGLPKAYLNYIVMDTAHRILDQGFVQVSQAAEVSKGKTKKSKRKKDEAGAMSNTPQAQHETLAVDLNIAESGYLYTYVSNESNWDVDVHFDQMQVQAVAAQPTVVQSDDFYPYGMSFQQQTGSVLKNKYLFNGKELQDELGLNLYDYKKRFYDPSLGRFISVDKLADQYTHWTTYQFAGLNPVKYVDLDGMEPAFNVPGFDYVTTGGDQLRINAPANVQYINTDVNPSDYDGLAEFGTEVILGFTPLDEINTFVTGQTIDGREAGARDYVDAGINILLIGRSGKGNKGEIHGNSKNSTRVQHRYEIQNIETGEMVKTGISGRELNKNGASPRANMQVNKLNKQAGKENYKAKVVEQNIPGRQNALQSEKQRVNQFFQENGRLPELQKLPKPDIE